MYKSIKYILLAMMFATVSATCAAAQKDADKIDIHAYFTENKVFEGQCFNYIVELEMGDESFNNIYVISESTTKGLRQTGSKRLNYSASKVDRKTGRRVIEIIYNTYVPTSVGECSIDGGVLLLEVLEPTTTYHPFWGSMKSYTTRDVELKIPKAKVKSTALPKSPADFSGLVGEFEISARETEMTVDKGEFNIVYTLQGTGVVPEGFMPDFKTIIGNGIQVRSIHPEERSFYRDGVLSSTVSYIVTCEASDYGDFTLPSMPIVYFNTSTKKYMTIQSGPVEINVKSKRPRSTAPGMYVLQPAEQEIHLTCF